tara:strand:- start:565 stop:738 length:174 start_codon:yes stop_codon:yes gene_type:complete
MLKKINMKNNRCRLTTTRLISIGIILKLSRIGKIDIVGNMCSWEHGAFAAFAVLKSL